MSYYVENKARIPPAWSFITVLRKKRVAEINPYELQEKE